MPDFNGEREFSYNHYFCLLEQDVRCRIFRYEKARLTDVVAVDKQSIALREL